MMRGGPYRTAASTPAPHEKRERFQRRAFAALTLAIGLIVGPFVAFVLEACSPAQRAAVESVVEKRAVPALKAACVLVRAFSSDGQPNEVCATIDELAPLVGEIIAGREMQTSAEVPSEIAPAVVLPPPKRHHPLRRCASWVPVVRLSDDGGRGDASDSGDGGKEGGDRGR